MTAPSSTSIRRLEPRDLEDVVRICNAAIARGESTYGPTDISADELRPLLFDVPAQFESYVWDGDDGAIAGWGALMRHMNRDIYPTVAELTVFVADDYRRRGIAHALVQHCFERANELGFRSLLLILQPDPAYTVAWAVRLGFRNVGWLMGVLPIGDRMQDILVFQRFMKEAR